MCPLYSPVLSSTGCRMTNSYICLAASHLTSIPPSQGSKYPRHPNTSCKCPLAGSGSMACLSTDFDVCSWGFDTETYGWTQYDVLMNVSNRPSWGAYAEIPEYGLAFYLNGAMDSMSSWQDYSGDTAPRTLQGMVVLDLIHHKVSLSLNSTASSSLTSEYLGQKYIH